MSDVFTKEKRSQIMSNIRSKGNKSTEQKMIDLFKNNNIKGWRRHYKLKGNPDFVFINAKIAVFVDGCFWHNHGCRNLKPKSNQDYWNKKIINNVERDKNINEYLTQKGWTVVRIWECELKKSKLEQTVDKINKFFK